MPCDHGNEFKMNCKDNKQISARKLQPLSGSSQIVIHHSVPTNGSGSQSFLFGAVSALTGKTGKRRKVKPECVWDTCRERQTTTKNVSEKHGIEYCCSEECPSSGARRGAAVVSQRPMS